MRRIPQTLALAAIAASVVGLSACSGGSAGGSAQSINVYLAQIPWSDELESLVPEFEAETGIDVNLTVLGDTQLAQQYQVMFNSGSAEADVSMVMSSVEFPRYVDSGWLADISDDVTGAADWDWEDFSEPARRSVTDGEGAVRAVPLVSEHFILMYRKDLLEQAGIAVPTTFAELEEAAAKLNDPAAGVYGYATRANGSAGVPGAASFVFGSGGDWTDSSGEASLDSDATVDGISVYGRLLHDSGAPGALNMGWSEAVALFNQGKVAFLGEADTLFPNVLDPEASRVADNVGFAAFPAGPAGHRVASYTPWSLSIPQSSKKADLGWQFIEWATSAEMGKTMLAAGQPVTRESAWADPEASAAFPADVAALVRGDSGIDYVGYASPQVVNISKSRDIVGTVLATAISGGDVESAARSADEELAALIESEKE
ncbi:ABC transporter substrate-binding protein [Microbacterium aurantiacum]|uniref:Sugar ABC transporter substrate-binding protein n=1 Tax=Microbacterium aurantiacum TaxID=162393 RepID=A0AAJ2LXE9_9MICO|nr:sugar ABC transporter substrate-binding protein [Microbacterium aurantiacum]MDS0244288.1 sugar ABC transporter substrate-binding protein [Microbacterium aurantiacum]